MEEPIPAPRPCSTPHSAPVAWLKAAATSVERYDPGILPPGDEANSGETPADEPQELTPEARHRQDVAEFLSAYERVAPEQERRDGWSPFLRKFFLQVVAEGGSISAACEYTGMSRSSAYSLEARDRVFAAGLAAAAYFARSPLADDFYEKAKHGITETVTRSDGATITRHRFDSRLSIAVLNRLDKRCDRAEERGSIHMAAVRNWDQFLSLVGDGDDQAAEALLETPQHCPTCPLPERANPIPVPDPPGWDPAESCWKDEDGRWMTTFPPPPGFDGHQNIPWDGDNHYERACTAEEAELLDAHQAAAEAEETAELTAFAEAQRDQYFAKLRTTLGSNPPSSFPRTREPSETSETPWSFPQTREPS